MSEKKKPLILVVDDARLNVQLVGTILREHDYDIQVARTGREAIDRCEQHVPDLILLDIMMPDMDGIETCSSLKNRDEFKDIPIIFLTAKNDTEDIVRGLQVGAVDYVAKPFNSYELLARVRTHLDLKQARDEQRRLIGELRAAMAKVKLLSGLLPICSSCKKIRDDGGYWEHIEEYIRCHSDADFSHGICPDCYKNLYPELWAKKMHKEKVAAEKAAAEEAQAEAENDQPE